MTFLCEYKRDKSCTGKYFKCLPTANSIKISYKGLYWNFATAMTASVSTVRITTLVYPRLAASVACSKILVSASSCMQGDRSVASITSVTVKDNYLMFSRYYFSMVSSHCGKLLG